MARFTMVRAKLDSASLTMRIQWATFGASQVTIGDAAFSRNGSVRVPIKIGARLTLTAIGRSGDQGEAWSVYLTPTFDGSLPIIARPLQPWRDYLSHRAAAGGRAATEFRRMLIEFRSPRMRLGLGRPVRLSGPVRQIGALPGRQDYLPLANSRPELRKKGEDHRG
jgi:hypothetical protein